MTALAIIATILGKLLSVTVMIAALLVAAFGGFSSAKNDSKNKQSEGTLFTAAAVIGLASIAIASLS